VERWGARVLAIIFVCVCIHNDWHGHRHLPTRTALRGTFDGAADTAKKLAGTLGDSAPEGPSSFSHTALKLSSKSAMVTSRCVYPPLCVNTVSEATFQSFSDEAVNLVLALPAQFDIARPWLHQLWR